MSYPPDCQDIQKFIEMRASTSGVLQIRLISFDCLRDHNSSKDRELEKEWYSARVEVALWKFKHQPWGASREIEAY
ncbi:hypothetical protein BOTBODRAFT_31781 [Botryobasidium botryosum FD-172 SS1]|uniref:Uncharacterized protein n=1 Tax=Botryobasidium botryosum (strain FD-172 SS1) TaxID=930990 RepID=A0A067MIU9_BOTB1|nr:hypothetical protein BOTBODRAFT_31781 [Botryobasidium botryosum FD-172 SS1]